MADPLDAPAAAQDVALAAPGPSRALAPRTDQAVLLDVITRAATDPQFDLDRVERLLHMHQQLVERQAQRDFTTAMARFKASAPKIIKDKTVKYQPQQGGPVSYKHASLGAVCDAAIRGLAAVDISHSWELERKEGRIIVTCILTHAGGHSTRTTLDGAPDDSGKKNTIQQTASTITYLERYTLLAATGLATEEDDDGAGADRATLSEEQVADLESLISEVGANKINFLAWAGVKSLHDILAENYSACVEAIEKKRKG